MEKYITEHATFFLSIKIPVHMISGLGEGLLLIIWLGEIILMLHSINAKFPFTIHLRRSCAFSFNVVVKFCNVVLLFS